MNPDAVIGHRRICHCGQPVIRVHTRPPSMNCDLNPTPIRTMADPWYTSPYFRQLPDDTFIQVNNVHHHSDLGGIPTGPTFACHHCPPPAMCRWCGHVHQAPADGGSNNNSNEKGTSA